MKNIRVAAFTHVNDGGAFIGTTELHVGVLDFGTSAFGACFFHHALGLDVVSLEAFDVGLQLLSEGRRKIGGLAGGEDRLRTSICVMCQDPLRFEGNGMGIVPWFSAPQASQLRTFFSLPFVDGRRFPQSVQKTNEPIAAMVLLVFRLRVQSRRITGFWDGDEFLAAKKSAEAIELTKGRFVDKISDRQPHATKFGPIELVRASMHRLHPPRLTQGCRIERPSFDFNQQPCTFATPLGMALPTRD